LRVRCARPGRAWRWRVAFLAWLGAIAAPPAPAASLSAKDLEVLARAAAFVQSPLPGTVLAVAYAGGDPASRTDAEAIAALLGEGLRVGGTLLRPKPVEVAALAPGGFAMVIAAAGANGPALSAASRSGRALCITADLAAVQNGLCTMAIRTAPRVEIVVNHNAAVAAQVEFAAAFRMMIREL
jgi:hypothetical protein